ncbi:MAG: hypothetical protein UW60_C0005G0031 [Candidatus Woesebacteria bacterium GW2011_GWA2_44_33]|uniref:Uncharacterized protein n=1 Tax=Candidatus Woesebacteria bacterium GW2011_GWA2_44_33 TaxID=1618564 RepID=A0A0G1LFP7_9BACT|nr:MAG: hypothetical protein UW60_C0005G0031 [Candidatus Woesebacteria bacterium GW2011_GWA2_44_33]
MFCNRHQNRPEAFWKAICMASGTDSAPYQLKPGTDTYPIAQLMIFMVSFTRIKSHDNKEKSDDNFEYGLSL